MRSSLRNLVSSSENNLIEHGNQIWSFFTGNDHLIEFHLTFSVDRNFLLIWAFDQNFYFLFWSVDQISLDIFS